MAGSSEDDLSPRNRLKLLCSYGGKILPRPFDRQLKYVGGETRVLAIHRSITFSELTEKVRAMYHAEAVIKYQLMWEDLDTLVSVTCDEDLHHMLDEYDRQDSLPNSPPSSPRLRVFLFPAQPQTAHVASSSSSSPSSVEQRYVDAINGLPVPPFSSNITGTTGRSIFSLSSPTSMSPSSSLDASAAAALSRELRIGGQPAGLSGGMHRVRSTPNMSSSALSPRSHHHHHQPATAPFSRLQKQCSVQFSTNPGPFSGPYRGTSLRYEACACHPVGFLQPQPLRPYYYVHSASRISGGGGGGCACCGHAEEACVPPPPPPRRVGHGSRFGSPPYKQAWE